MKLMVCVALVATVAMGCAGEDVQGAGPECPEGFEMNADGLCLQTLDNSSTEGGETDAPSADVHVSDDGGSVEDTGPEIEAPETQEPPMAGAWTFGSGTWTSDGCQATFLSTPTGWTLSQVTETGFNMTIQFAEAGSLFVSTACALSEDEYTCDLVTQQFSIGPSAITLGATSQGSFSGATSAELEVTFDIECTGSGCGGLLSANPCTSVQTFNVFFDG